MLLNQRVIAGLGNVYKSEVAFAAGVNPFRAMSTLTRRELEVMAEVSQKWLRVKRARRREGRHRHLQRQPPHYRGVGPRRAPLGLRGVRARSAARCGGLVEMRKQGEQARSTYWCPSCQPWLPAQGQSAEAPVGRMLKLLGPRRKVGC